MLTWKFYLKDLLDETAIEMEVNEPIGWDKVSFSLQRSDNYIGLENLYSDTLEFDGAGYDLLKQAYENYGFEGRLSLTIEAYCNGILEKSIINEVMLSTYVRLENTVSIKAESSGFDRVFKNRLTTPVNLDSPVGIDGFELSDIEKKSIVAHSKEISLINQIELDSEVYNSSTYKLSVTGSQPDYDAPPYEALFTEDLSIGSGSGCVNTSKDFYTQYDFSEIVASDESLGSLTGIPFGVDANPNPFFNCTANGTLNINVSLNVASYIRAIDISSNILGITAKKCGCPDSANMGINAFYGTPNFAYSLYIRVGANVTEIPITDQGAAAGCTEAHYGDLYGKNYETFDFSNFVYNSDTVRFRTVTANVSLPVISGDDVYVLLKCQIDGSYQRRGSSTAVRFVNGSWIDAIGSSITIQSVSTEPPSVIKGYYLYEAFNRVCESITGELDSFRSDFFGRDNSTPTSYESDGCGGWVLLTNGLNIRQMKRKDGTEFPITASFDQLFEACNSIWSLGMRIEEDEYGKRRVRVEPKKYFFQTEVIKSFTNVPEITRRPAVDLIYNEFECGYDKWRIGTGNLNFIDEFNTKRQYSIPVKNIKNKLSKPCSYITSGYAIELTRRVQYSQNPTSDFETDDDNFLICLNVNTVTSSLYTYPPVSTSYEKGAVSERDENFSSIVNYFSPQTIYNARISPANNAQAWFAYIYPSAVKMGYSIKFQSGDGNYQQYQTQIDDCSLSNGTLYQDQDMTAESIRPLDRLPLYIPNYLEFEVPMSLSDFEEIEIDSNKQISVSCGGETSAGFVKEIKYLPNIEGGYAEVKLIEGFCYGGEYDSSFDSSFTIGRC
jgi:hypothetical protein